MPTTGKGLPYPSGSDRVMDGDDAIHSLASSVDDLTGASGTVSITPDAVNTTKSAAIAFGKTFKVTPVVMVTPVGSTFAPGAMSYWVTVPTTTGATINMQRAVVSPCTFQWLAVPASV